MMQLCSSSLVYYIVFNKMPNSTTHEPLSIYGDPAYLLWVHLQAPCRDAVMTQQMQEFNASISAVRMSVEWLFGNTLNYFKFVDLKKKKKSWCGCSFMECTDMPV